ncbi:DUF2784 domain-containing protein [bacterium]|nr:DUF2784 domain-containing protein [bacterium]
MNPAFWSDVLLVLHFAFVLGVILPVPLIAVGALFHWRWVQNAWFRFAHLGMIGVVTLESVAGVICPLTIWENQLREAAGSEGYQYTFMRYWISRLLFYDAEPWVFTAGYIIFTLMILSLFWIAPIRLRRNKNQPRRFDLTLAR